MFSYGVIGYIILRYSVSRTDTDTGRCTWIIEVDVYCILLVTALYLPIKYHPLKSPFRHPAIAGSDPSNYIDRSFHNRCCSETGTVVKISLERARLSESKLEASDSLLKTSMVSASASCRKKGFTHDVAPCILLLVVYYAIHFPYARIPAFFLILWHRCLNNYSPTPDTPNTNGKPERLFSDLRFRGRKRHGARQPLLLFSAS